MSASGPTESGPQPQARRPLRLTCLALGSRGDVQPFVALGQALQARGHQVCIATELEYLELARQAGLGAACVGGSILEQMDFEMVYQSLDAAGKSLPLGFALSFLKQIGPLVERIVAESLAACQGADGILASTLGRYPGQSVAEHLGLRLLPVHFHPHAPTRSYPDLSFPDAPAWLPAACMPGRGAYRLLTHTLGAQGLWQILRPAVNHARRNVLGLPALSARSLWRQVSQPPDLSLYAYSPFVAPPPPDWSAAQAVTGYWFLPPSPDWQPQAELQIFLENGPPPVYIGFGSLLAGRDPDGVTRLVLEALEQSRQRGLLYAGWGDFARQPLPPTCLRIESVPHAWLFPRLAAVVSHCGAGTTAAALRAGVPVVGVPFFGDQLFWSRQVQALGAGPAPVPRSQLTADSLARAIQQATRDPAIRQQASSVGQLLQAEDGVRRAVELVERYFG